MLIRVFLQFGVGVRCDYLNLNYKEVLDLILLDLRLKIF